MAMRMCALLAATARRIHVDSYTANGTMERVFGVDVLDVEVRAR